MSNRINVSQGDLPLFDDIITNIIVKHDHGWIGAITKVVLDDVCPEYNLQCSKII